MKIRKQVYDLTLNDLQLTPIWEFAHDEEGEEGQDEVTVRPLPLFKSLETIEVMCVARAQFHLADGTMMGGYLSPGVPGDADIGHLQPTIIAEEGQVCFWCGIVEPERENLEESYKILGKRPNDIFPISFSLDVPTIHPLSGTIAGFLVVSDVNFQSVRVVQ
ncbi:MAG: hypothetical protein V4724_21745 [Pseudomonadota bacterium]